MRGDLAGFDDLVASIDYPMFIVTTAAGGDRAGCLVGFVTQASMRPARLIVCLSKENRTLRVAQRATALAVHFLAHEDRSLSELFGELTGDDVDKFSQCDWEEGPSGLPILQTMGWVVASILEQLDAGDHVTFLVEPFDSEIRQPGARQLSFQQVRDMKPGHRVD